MRVDHFQMWRKYSQTEKEGLGIVWVYEKFQLYLIGTEFDLFNRSQTIRKNV